MDSDFYNRVGGDRITSRQIDELIGLARGLIADGKVSQEESSFCKSGWLPIQRSAISQSSEFS